MIKKCLLAVFVSALSFVAHSQVRWYLFAGPQTTSTRFRLQDVKQKAGYQYGFHAGLGTKLPVEGRLYFSPSVFFTRKGYKVDFDRPGPLPDSAATDNATTINMIQLSLLLQHDFSVGKGHLFFRAGPALDFAINGKETFTKASGSVSRNMVFSFDNYGRFGSSGELHFGYEKTGGFMIWAFYSHGLGNVSNVDNGPKIRHQAAGLSLGIHLRKK